jgi:type IV secretory pathway ATPase VirB11/archaellum biosynthesis ATPase
MKEEDAVVKNILKPLRAHFKSNIKELIMNEPSEVLLETTSGIWEHKKDKTLNYSWFKSMATIMSSMTGQKFNSSTSIMSFKLPEGHRVQIVHGESTKHKFLLSIRLFRGIIFKLDDYNISSSDKEKIINAVRNKHSLLISGGT